MDKIVIEQKHPAHTITIEDCYMYASDFIKVCQLNNKCYVNKTNIPALASALLSMNVEDKEQDYYSVFERTVGLYESSLISPEDVVKELMKDFIIIKKPQ